MSETPIMHKNHNPHNPIRALPQPAPPSRATRELDVQTERGRNPPHPHQPVTAATKPNAESPLVEHPIKPPRQPAQPLTPCPTPSQIRTKKEPSFHPAPH